jgi:hypothetical protein
MTLPAKLTNLICPNPKCKEEFSKPILLTDFSNKPAVTYQACPRCLTQLDVALDTEKVPEMIPIPEQEITAREEEKAASEEVELERLEEPEKLEAPEKEPAKPSESEEEAPPGCPHYVGYLSKRPKGTSIPEECLTCPKMIDCTLRR